MLTSSDAKWRCMWHMLVWSILLTLVSQFLNLVDHIAFYILASLSMIVLPILTAIYSNTAGRHCAGLLRVAYVFCDPVLACITLTPLLLLNHLPGVVTYYNCLSHKTSWNITCDCILNHSGNVLPEDFQHGQEKTDVERKALLTEVSARFVVIQISVVVPILLSLLMGRRTHKMAFSTYIMTFAYWFVTAIESVDMIETSHLGDLYKTVIYTTEAMITITMIITNSYAIVTLCSYITPRAGRPTKQYSMRFDFIYRVFVGASGILFSEVPLLVARFQIVTVDIGRILPATFYLFFIKDFLFMCIIIAIILAQKFSDKSVMKLPCKIRFDNTDVVFKPEKRDAYIADKKTVTFQDPPATTFGEDSKPDDKNSKSGDKKPNSVLKNGHSNVGTSPATGPATNTRLHVREQYALTDLSLVNTSLVCEKNSTVPFSGVRCLPLTDHPSSSQTPSPTILSSGTRLKLSNLNCVDDKRQIQEIKSRPNDTDSDCSEGTCSENSDVEI